MENKEDLIINVKHLKNKDIPQSVTFNIFTMTETFEQAIALLKQSNTSILANSLNSDKQFNIYYREVLSIEYVERNIYLYTKDGTFWVKKSLVSITSSLPKYFVQVSKNTIINVLKIKAIETSFNGNLVITLKTNEQVIVSRRYIKTLKKKLEKIR